MAHVFPQTHFFVLVFTFSQRGASNCKRADGCHGNTEQRDAEAWRCTWSDTRWRHNPYLNLSLLQMWHLLPVSPPMYSIRGQIEHSVSRFNAGVASDELILHHTLRKCEIFASKYPRDCDCGFGQIGSGCFFRTHISTTFFKHFSWTAAGLYIFLWIHIHVLLFSGVWASF